MRVSFLSDLPCAFFVNGIHLGPVDGFERCVELAPHDGAFCEFKAARCVPVRFRFDEAFLFEPPEETELYFCGGAVTVRLRNFVHADPTLRILWKRQVAESTLTLCLQGRLLLHYEHGATKTVLPLPFAFEQCRVSPAGERLLLEADTMFAILDRSGTIAVLSDGKVTERGRTVTAEVPLHDSLARRMRCRYENGRLSECTPLSARPPQEATVAIALLESVLAGFDPTPYLAPALAPKAGLLREYLGRFTAAVYRGREQVGLVYPRRPRIFDVRDFRVTLENGKVANLAPL